MPLVTVTTPQFLFRRRLFLDPYLDTINDEASIFDIPISVDFNPHKVQSLEITDFLLPRNYTPMAYTSSRGTNPGNNYVDVRVTTYPVPTNTLTFSWRIPATREYVDSPAGFLADPVATPAMANISRYVNTLATQLDIHMDDLGDPTFNTFNGWNWRVAEGQPFSSGRYGNIHYMLELGGAPNTATVEFLFGTGANVAESAWSQLGFTEGVDSVSPQTINGTLYTGAIPDRYIEFNPDRYVDISFDEIPELTPHSRLWTTHSHDYKYNDWCVEKVRLLTDPPRRIETLTTRIRLPDGRIPNIISYYSWDLTLDLLLVSPETKVPEWVNQFLSLD